MKRLHVLSRSGGLGTEIKKMQMMQKKKKIEELKGNVGDKSIHETHKAVFPPSAPSQNYRKVS